MNGLELYLCFPSLPAQACHGVTFTLYFNIPTYINYIWSKKNITFCILFLPSTEAVIHNSPTILYTHLLHGTVNTVYFFYKTWSHIFSMTHTHFVNVEQRTLFTLSLSHMHAHMREHGHAHTHTLSYSIWDTTHTWVSISCSNSDKMIHLMAESPSLMDLVFPCNYGTN